MARRFETILKVKRGDNLGDPEFWNRRFEDLDRRVDSNEKSLDDIDAVADRVESVALQRIDTVVTPLVEETQERVRSIPAMFSASSVSTVTVGMGTKFFVVDAGQRNTFAALAYALIEKRDDASILMLGRVQSFDRETGGLVVDVLQTSGTGNHSDWRITLSAPPDLSHAARTDNPHGVTASQIGAYTQAQINTMLTAYAPKNNPTFTGSPTAPTQPGTDNSTRIATTAFVQALIATVQSSIAGLAPKDAPALTGAATAETPLASDNSTRIATTAFVQHAVASLVNAAPAALDTLNELAVALGNDPNFATTITNALAGKAAATHAHAASDITSGTLSIARLPVATSGVSNTTQVVRADDSRLSNARAPTAHSHAISDVTSLQDALNAKQAALGFTPIQQGGGTGQNGNKVTIGWDGIKRLLGQVDALQLGYFWVSKDVTRSNGVMMFPNGFTIMWGTNTGTTDASGNFSVAYPSSAWSAAPFIYVINGDPSANPRLPATNGTTLSGFTCRLPGAVAGEAYRVNWIAVGDISV